MNFFFKLLLILFVSKSLYLVFFCKRQDIIINVGKVEIPVVDEDEKKGGDIACRSIQKSCIRQRQRVAETSRDVRSCILLFKCHISRKCHLFQKLLVFGRSYYRNTACGENNVTYWLITPPTKQPSYTA